jgi:Zn-dependent M16 (insulinase) family peptidase
VLVQTNLQAGVKIGGFEIIARQDLEELQAIGIWARHIQTGAEVFHIYNDDDENLFAFAFPTIPADSSGVAHILEHSVLCGSQKYPLKDTFIVLAKGSLQTFLNAMTFPDKTVYPAASTNRQDYFNLLSVYGDAVFHPLLDEWIFQQEGHRLELQQDESSGSWRLERTGVVYNEMKGNYSSVDPIAADWSFRAVLPDTPYAYDSGGDPREIPKLRWEDLKAFHREHYNPANCKIVLCGNIPTEEQLAFLHEHILAGLEPGRPVDPIPLAKPWTQSRELSIPYPATDASQKSTVLLSWALLDSTDADESLALAALSEILLGHDGSPLHKALVESGLGEDVAPATGMEGEIRHLVFTVGLRGMDGTNKKALEDLVMSTLKDLADKGIPKEEIEGALFGMRFANQEIRRAGGPFSLIWMRRVLRSWIHGKAPWNTLLFEKSYRAMTEKLSANPRYFEGLIEQYLINNPHRCLLSVDPQVGLSEAQEAETRAELEHLLANLSDAEKAALAEQTRRLKAIQESTDAPEALARLPHISRKDLVPEVESVPRGLHDLGGIPLLSHELFTNGIVYIDVALPVDVLTAEQYLWLPLLARTIPGLGLPGIPYNVLSSRMALQVGGFYSILHTSSPVKGTAQALATPGGIYHIRGRDFMIFRMKTLHEKLEPALDLVLPLIAQADFSDIRRLKDLLIEYKNDMDASVVPSGHQYAISQASRAFSRARSIDDLWNGIPQLEFAHRLLSYTTEEVAQKLSALRDELIAKSGILVNITAQKEGIEAGLALLKDRLGSYGGPRPGHSSELKGSPQDDRIGSVYQSGALQVGFAALALPGSPFASETQAGELVLSHWLSTGILWEDIRMRGGAYGAFAYPDGLEPVFVMATYRDPTPVRSLDALPGSLKKALETLPDGEELEKAVIGAFAKETRPRTNPDKGFSDFLRYITGIEDWMRKRKLEAIVAMDKNTLKRAGEALVASLDKAKYAVIAGNGQASASAEKLQVPLQDLPGA